MMFNKDFVINTILVLVCCFFLGLGIDLGKGCIVVPSLIGMIVFVSNEIILMGKGFDWEGEE